jgi:hypothetical protein
MRKNKYLNVSLLGNDLEICLDYFDSDIFIFDEIFTTDRFPFVGQIALAGRPKNDKLEISIRAYLYPLISEIYNPYDFEKTEPLSLSNQYVVKNKKQFSQAILVVTEELNANAKDLIKKSRWYLD